MFLQNSIASYIRLFEPLVIKALKQYTVTSQLDLQRQVLDLLSQLIQLRVNYCLLDSDQVRLLFTSYLCKTPNPFICLHCRLIGICIMYYMYISTKDSKKILKAFNIHPLPTFTRLFFTLRPSGITVFSH